MSQERCYRALVACFCKVVLAKRLLRELFIKLSPTAPDTPQGASPAFPLSVQFPCPTSCQTNDFLGHLPFLPLRSSYYFPFGGISCWERLSCLSQGSMSGIYGSCHLKPGSLPTVAGVHLCPEKQVSIMPKILWSFNLLLTKILEIDIIITS